MNYPVKKSLFVGLGLCATLGAQLSPCLAQGTALTYQGKLTQAGQAANGLHDFEFRLFNAATGGTQQGSTVVVNDLAVTDGLFTATLDFGGAAFPGADRWLEISVRPGASTGAYSLLNPRQALTAAPYAVRALEANTVPAGAITSSLLANGAVTSSKLAPGAVTSLGAADGSPANAVQVNTNGLVGIGTNTPLAGLHVAAGQPFVNLELMQSFQDERDGLVNLGGAEALAVDGNRMAVVAIYDSGLTLFDVSNPSAPGWTAQVRSGDPGFANLGQVHRVALRSNLLAVATYDGAVALVDVSNPYSPVMGVQLRDGQGG